MLISWINCESSKDEDECKFDNLSKVPYSSCVIIGSEVSLEDVEGGKSERTDQVGFSGFLIIKINFGFFH